MGVKRQRTLEEFAIRSTLEIRSQQRSFGGSSEDPIVIEEDQEEIRCPLCNAEITHLEAYVRDAHAQKCLDQLAGRKRPKSLPTSLPSMRNINVVQLCSTSVVVDGFASNKDRTIEHYFLSHFHSDHYGGLKKSWKNGVIYGSRITINLVRNKFRICESRLRPLPMNKKIWISDKVSVVLLDANHCPGATVFLFQEYDNDNVVKTVLHTGDFRANSTLIEELNKWTDRFDDIYLDTTYLIPGFHFPSQESVLEVTSSFVNELVNRGFKSVFQSDQKSIDSFSNTVSPSKLYDLLILVGTYTIGKEKLAISLAQTLKTKIFIPADTTRYQMVSQYIEYFPPGSITHDVKESCVHLIPISILNSKNSIQSYFRKYDKIYRDLVGFIPTGWTFKNKWSKIAEFPTISSRINYCKEILENTKDNFNIEFILRQFKKYQRYQVFKIPYSEHSSFRDLVNFGCSVNCKTIWATVNMDNINEMDQWFMAWQNMRNDNTVH